MRPSTQNIQQCLILDSDEEQEERRGIMKKYGTFETDKPIRIVCHAITNFGIDPNQTQFTAEDVFYKIKWQKRRQGNSGQSEVSASQNSEEKEGTEPQCSYWKAEEIRKHCPRLLIDYLIQSSVLRISQDI